MFSSLQRFLSAVALVTPKGFCCKKSGCDYSTKDFKDLGVKAIIDILDNSNNGALLMNDTKELKYISSMLNKKSDVITSDIKEHSKLYDQIMFNSHMGDYEVLLNTTTIVAGVNINNSKITDIIVSGIKDIGTIKQYVARFRDLKEVNIHIFNNYKEECKVYEIEWLISEDIKNSMILRDSYNLVCNGSTEFTTLGLNKNPINLDSNIYFNADTNTYEVDTVYIKSYIYNKYYHSRTIESFKCLLEEYFDHIEIIQELKVCEATLSDKKAFKKDLKEAKKEAKEVLEKYKDILVGYSEIKKNKRSFKLMEYQNLNGISMEQVQKDYLKYGIHDLILDNSLKSMIDLYSSFVLDNDFSLDLAWKFANMHNRTKGKILGQISVLVYEELKKEHPNAFSTDYSIEVRLYEWLINEFKPGTSYTQEHLEMLAEALRFNFGDNWSLTTKKIGEILNIIYKIDSKKIKICPPIETLFYKNIIPIGGQGKRINAYTIKSRIDIQDIKNELAVTSSDLSLDYSIQKIKSKILNQLDNNEKQILLEGIF